LTRLGCFIVLGRPHNLDGRKLKTVQTASMPTNDPWQSDF